MSKSKLHLLLAGVGCVLLAGMAAAETAQSWDTDPAYLANPLPFDKRFYASVNEYYEQLQEKVSHETPKESVYALMDDYLFRTADEPDASLPAEIYRRMNREPRVKHLFDYIETASGKQRDELRDVVSAACEQFLQEVPSYVPLPPRGVRKACHAHPRGAMAYPVLLAKLDDTGKTMPLILRLLDAFETGARKEVRDHTGDSAYETDPAKHPVGSQACLLTVYALNLLMDRIANNPDSLTHLTPGQLAAVNQFLDAREKGDEHIEAFGNLVYSASDDDHHSFVWDVDEMAKAFAANGVG